MPMTKHLKVAIIDSNPALSNGLCIKREDPPDPRVSTVTPATISLFKGIEITEQFFALFCNNIVSSCLSTNHDVKSAEIFDCNDVRSVTYILGREKFF